MSINQPYFRSQSQISPVYSVVRKNIPDGILFTTMKTTRVVITSRPGTWQKFLQNDIGSYPFVQVIGVAHGSLTAVQLVKEHQPDILLIDSNIPVEEAIAILHNIKLENPSVLMVIIADTYQHQRSFTKAGANFVVSTYEFKSKMQDIFDQCRESSSNVSGNIEDDLRTNI